MSYSTEGYVQLVNDTTTLKITEDQSKMFNYCMRHFLFLEFSLLLFIFTFISLLPLYK